jgi:hypothetical protein
MVDRRYPTIANENAFQGPLVLWPGLVPVKNCACYVRDMLPGV